LYYCWQKDNLQLKLYVQPRAKKNKVIGLHGGCLKVAITAPPIEDKANKYLIKFFAKCFNVAKNQVEITKGHNSRYKTLLVSGPKKHLIIAFNNLILSEE
jgi:uncharacterized protein (TIGR00251 family)